MDASSKLADGLLDKEPVQPVIVVVATEGSESSSVRDEDSIGSFSDSRPVAGWPTWSS